MDDTLRFSKKKQKKKQEKPLQVSFISSCSTFLFSYKELLNRTQSISASYQEAVVG